jgi:mono/diheme cytochrome c family protein
MFGSRLVAQGNPEAAKLQNPVASTALSIADGKRAYQRYCANCHGSNAEGGPGNDLTPPAPDLTLKQLKHGSTDGEVFSVIKNGIPPDFNMAAWGTQGLADDDVWKIVNYLRTLTKK